MQRGRESSLPWADATHLVSDMTWHQVRGWVWSPRGRGAQGPARNEFPTQPSLETRRWGVRIRPGQNRTHPFSSFFKNKRRFLERVTSLSRLEPWQDPTRPSAARLRGRSQDRQCWHRALAPDLAPQPALPWTALPSPSPQGRRLWERLAGWLLGKPELGLLPAPPSHCTVPHPLGPAGQWDSVGRARRALSGRSANPPPDPLAETLALYPLRANSCAGGTGVARRLLLS